MAEDELFQVKNHFYLGAYQLAINEATESAYSEESKTELDCLVYRSYIGMGNYGVRAREGGRERDRGAGARRSAPLVPPPAPRPRCRCPALVRRCSLTCG